MALLKHCPGPADQRGALSNSYWHEGRSDHLHIDQSRTSVAVPHMRVAAQITPFWRGTGGHAGDQVGAHIGGSLRERPEDSGCTP